MHHNAIVCIINDCLLLKCKNHQISHKIYHKSLIPLAANICNRYSKNNQRQIPHQIYQPMLILLNLLFKMSGLCIYGELGWHLEPLLWAIFLLLSLCLLLQWFSSIRVMINQIIFQLCSQYAQLQCHQEASQDLSSILKYCQC